MKNLFFVLVAALVLSCATGHAAFKINELDADTPGGDSLEFVELKGNPGESADGLALFFFDGGTTSALFVVDGQTTSLPVKAASYMAVDLDGLHADANGYLVIGHQTVIPPPARTWTVARPMQNGEDAVALYQVATATTETIPEPTQTNLVDFVVYESGADTNGDWSGFGTFTVFNEDGELAGESDVVSLQRYPESGTVFVGGTPTPSTTNTEGLIIAPVLVQMPRANQFKMPTTATVTFHNSFNGSSTFNTVTMDAGSSTELTVLSTPTLPAGVTKGKDFNVVVQLNDPDTSVDKVYGATLHVTTSRGKSSHVRVPIVAEFVRATASAAPGSVVINEFAYDGTGGDWNGDGDIPTQQYDEFVELYNTTGAPINIEGWEQRVSDGNNLGTYYSYVFPKGATIPAHGFVVVFTGGNPTGFAPGVAYTFVRQARLRNLGGYVDIRDANNTIIDGVSYLDAEPLPLPGYTPIGLNPTTVATGSYARQTDGGSTWLPMLRTTTNDRPTPGASNIQASVRDWQLF